MHGPLKSNYFIFEHRFQTFFLTEHIIYLNLSTSLKKDKIGVRNMHEATLFVIQ